MFRRHFSYDAEVYGEAVKASWPWFMQSQLVADWTGMAVLAGHDELMIL